MTYEIGHLASALIPVVLLIIGLGIYIKNWENKK